MHPKLQSVHLLLVATLLTLASCYRLYPYRHTPIASPLHPGTKVAYYFLSALPEWACSVLYVAFDLNNEFDLPGAKLREKQAKALKNGGVWPERERGKELESPMPA